MRPPELQLPAPVFRAPIRARDRELPVGRGADDLLARALVGIGSRLGPDEIPAAVVATFARGGRNFQRIHDRGAERRSAELWVAHS